jgi:hypothetical protein
MENFFAIFPRYGKNVSTLWKNFHFGLFLSAPLAHGAVLRGLLSGARGAL